MVNTLALSVTMSATAWAGVRDWYLSRLTYLLRRSRQVNTHPDHAAVFFTCRGDNDWGTQCCWFCDWKGVFTWNGLAFSDNEMWKSSPSIVLICPLKNDGNSSIMSTDMGVIVKLLTVVAWDIVSGVTCHLDWSGVTFR